MRALAALALLIWSLGGSALAGNADVPANVESSVTQAVERFVAAWNRNDTTALMGLFTPNGTFQSPRGAKAEGRQQIRNLLTKEHAEIYKGTALAASVIQVGNTGKASPVATGSYTLDGVNAVLWFDVSVKGSFAFRFVQRDDRWLIASARISRE